MTTLGLPPEPVIIDDGTPKWLLKEKTGENLKDPDLWRCNKCHSTQKSINSKPKQCTSWKGKCNSKSFTKITGHINPLLWLLPIWIVFSKFDMKDTYDQLLALIKKLVIFPQEIDYKIYTLWIISTWKLEQWETVAFLVFLGIPNSGKSRALRIISQLAYRAIKASGVTSVVIPRLCHYFNITLLIDEAQNKLHPRRSGGSELIDFLKDSYKVGSTYITCDSEDQSKVVVTKNFGFKAFAGEKSFNPGFLSRSITFWMEREEPEIAKLSYVKKELQSIQSKLLYYRFMCDNPPDLGSHFSLKGRTREIYESIISTAQHIGIDVDDVIEHALEREKKEADELKDSTQYDILVIINNYDGKKSDPDGEDGSIRLIYLLRELRWESGIASDDRKALQHLGYLIKNMGLQRKRTRIGRVIPLTEEPNITRLNRLNRRYGL
jgi:hypothetical protein